jgi:hypothetical protein
VLSALEGWRLFAGNRRVRKAVYIRFFGNGHLWFRSYCQQTHLPQHSAPRLRSASVVNRGAETNVRRGGGLGADLVLVGFAFPCGSEPAREGGVPFSEDVEFDGPFASRLAPTGISVCREVWVCRRFSVGASLLAKAVAQVLARAPLLLLLLLLPLPLPLLCFDFDLSAPLTTLAERRHCAVGNPAWMPG